MRAYEGEKWVYGHGCVRCYEEEMVFVDHWRYVNDLDGCIAIVPGTWLHICNETYHAEALRVVAMYTERHLHNPTL